MISDPDGHPIDDVMAVLHPAPRSYTGEDLVEISCHGNPLIAASILDAIGQTALARLAERGEFTRRAFINGKLDLPQAEAVGALINAGSNTGLAMAGNLLHGNLSAQVASLRSQLDEIKTAVEAAFILEDQEVETAALYQKITGILETIRAELQGSRNSSAIYSGITCAIAGRPNAGKSSLLNAILGYSRAIVHEDEGTTRDIISEHVVVDGIDFIFHDTAGIRDVSSGPEKIGIEKTKEAFERADLVIYVIDAARGLHEEELAWLRSGKKTIAVFNKTDLCQDLPAPMTDIPTICISAKHHQNIDGLLQAMKDLYPSDLPRIFIERHVSLFERAGLALERAREALKEGLPPDIWIMDIDEAVHSLKNLTGEDFSDDVLDSVFSRFCVGK